jgi:hypothetical protein
MTQWEYRYVNLWAGEIAPGADPFAGFAGEMYQAGLEGWEAVGEVRVTYRSPEAGTYTEIPCVLLKRPLGG